MSSQQVSLVPSQRVENGLNSQLLFQDDNSRYRVGDPGPKTRELTGFIDDKIFPVDRDRDRYFGTEFRRSIHAEGVQRRDPSESGHSDGDEDDDDDDMDEEDDVEGVDEGDSEVHGFIAVGNSNKNNSIGTNTNTNSGATDNKGATDGVHSGVAAAAADKLGNGISKHLSSFGSMMVKEGNMQSSVNNAVTIAEPDGDLYYSQYLQATEGSASVQKDVVTENGCGFSGRKDVSFSSESGESLGAILSDPVTGALMDDAMILPCGHSFGAAGMQHVNRTKACYTCSQPVSEESIAPNLSLRAAVQAFRREEDLQFFRSSKRRRERLDQDKGSYGDPTLTDPPRGRGVQFPFAVTDRVIIKGNKRTPQRFVGREAVVTTQCLNGWYVVKTLDNAESVKLQYRSLAKVSDDSSSKAMSSKMAPNWL